MIARIEVTPEPVSIAFGGATPAESSIWVLSRAQGKVARIDPKTNKVIATIDLGFTNADGNLAFGDGFVWVSAPGFPITKISPQLEKEKVVQQFAGDGGGQIYYGLNSIWLTQCGLQQRVASRYETHRRHNGRVSEIDDNDSELSKSPPCFINSVYYSGDGRPSQRRKVLPRILPISSRKRFAQCWSRIVTAATPHRR